MTSKVDEFLAKAIAEEIRLREEERARNLIAAGLYEQERVYSDDLTSDCPNYDVEKKKYYGTKKKPIEVTDSEYAEILKHIGANDVIKAAQTTDDNSAERTLGGIATLFLVLAILIVIIGFCVLLCGLAYGMTVFAVSLLLFVVLLGTWAIMKVLANISLTLKEINSKTKR